MRRKIFQFWGIALIAIIITWAFIAYLYFNPYVLHGGVREFGSLQLGGDVPLGPGDYTFAPEMQIPQSKFYINIAQKGLWCVFEECSPEGEKIAALGGWLQSEDTTDEPEIMEIFGLDDNVDITSIIVVGNREARIVGIYPGKRIEDLPSVLRMHQDIIGQQM